MSTRYRNAHQPNNKFTLKPSGGSPATNRLTNSHYLNVNNKSAASYPSMSEAASYTPCTPLNSYPNNYCYSQFFSNPSNSAYNCSYSGPSQFFPSQEDSGFIDYFNQLNNFNFQTRRHF